MAYGLFDREVFTAVLDDNTEVKLTCFYQRTASGFRHLCYIGDVTKQEASWDVLAYFAKQCWCNRAWERFTYETVLQNAIEKFPKEQQQTLKDQLIEKKYKKVSDECDNFLKVFKATHDRLSQERKQQIAKSVDKIGLIQTNQQAKAVLLSMQMMDAIDTVQSLTEK